jgi:hypothetical protein
MSMQQTAEPARVRVRRGTYPSLTGKELRLWYWRCTACGWLGGDHYSQQGALREACRHLNDGCPS